MSLVGRRWAGVAPPARAIVWVTAGALVYGTAVHVVQLVSGTSPSTGLPGWLAAYFAALVLLDPAAAALLLRRTRTGVILTGPHLGTNAAANAYANFVLMPGGPVLGRVAPFVIGLLALAHLCVAPWIWPTRIPAPDGAAHR